MELKFCKDCKHSVGNGSSAKCHHPQVSGNRYDLVTGEAIAYYCSTERGGSTNSICPCGKYGALWEAK